MKRMFVLIFVLQALALIGCSNTDPSGEGDNPAFDNPAFDNPAGITDAQNVALNDGVRQLGELTGYSKLYSSKIGLTTRSIAKNSGELDGELDEENKYEKLFIKDKTIKLSMGKDLVGNGEITHQAAYVFELGMTVDRNKITITYNPSPDSGGGTISKDDYKDYEIYNMSITTSKAKIPNGDWFTHDDTGDLVTLIKINKDAEGNVTSLSMLSLSERTDKEGDVIQNEYYSPNGGKTFDEIVGTYSSY